MFNILLVWVVLVSIVKGQKDPCMGDGHKTIPNIGFRFVNYRLDPTDVLFHDYQLPSGWYSVGDVTMPEHPPDDIFTCGTKFPVWLNGSHPKDKVPVTLTACQLGIINDCDVTYNITVKNCGTFYVYKLNHTTGVNVGYCFGIGKTGDPPKYVPPKPLIQPGIDVKYGRNNRTISSASFSCVFEESKTDRLQYIVSWYMNGDLMFGTDYSDSPRNAALRLTEKKFTDHGFWMGSDISCSVRAFFQKDSSPGKSSVRADDYFAGIKVLTKSLTFGFDEKDSSKRSIRLQSTVPIGCKGGTCDLRLLSFVPDNSVHGMCTGLAFDQSTCGVKISAVRYNDTLSIPLRTVDNGQYAKAGSYEVFLKTAPTDENLIWGSYTLAPIKVNIEDNSIPKVYEGKRCQSHNDPHMTTFDRRRYDNHQEGEYILYRNTKYNTEVQAKYQHCGTREHKSIKCNCGVAVKAGQDLFEVNLCNNKMFIGYRFCADKTLEVKSQGEWKYKIFLEYGTYVETTISDHYINTDIVPSSHDTGGVVFGLCGDLNGDYHDDFHYRPGEGHGKPNLNEGVPVKNYIHNGNDYNYEINHQPTNFTNVWKVRSEAENLFSPNVNKSSFIPWTFKACVCTNTTVDKSRFSSEVENSIPCTPNGVASCTNGKTLGTHTCSVYKSRRRRSADRNPLIPTVSIESSRIQKNDAWPGSQTLMTSPPSGTAAGRTLLSSFKPSRDTTTTAMTVDQAKQYCQEKIGSSPVFSLCSNVPSVNPNSSLDTCIADIMVTRTVEWTKATGEAMQDSCLSELRRNTTLRETKGNKTSIAEEIEDLACPNNCSSTGVCNKGKCSCAVGYGGSDCSIDITKGPTISGLLDHGMCDEKDMPCDHAYVFGSIFTDSDNLTCQLEEFSISADGSRQKSRVHYIDGEFESLVEVMCPLSHTRRKRSAPTDTDVFVTGYTISISNGGNLFEKGADLFIYDSTCQLAQNDSNTIHFTLKAGFCFIDNVCVQHGAINPKDNCLNCDELISTTSWTASSTNGCSNQQSVTKEGSTNYLWVIGVVAGVLVGIVVGFVVVIKLTKNRGKRVSDSSLFEKPSSSLSPGSTTQRVG